MHSYLQTRNGWVCAFIFMQAVTCHRGYSWIIIWQKCRDIGLNGFIFEKICKNCNIKERKKSWGLFKICLLNSTANPANLHLDWAELAVLFSRQILNSPNLFLSFIFYLIFEYENIETHAPAFLSHNNSSAASVPYLWEIFDNLFQISTFQSRKMYNVYNKPIYCFLCGRIQRQFFGILEPQNM